MLHKLANIDPKEYAIDKTLDTVSEASEFEENWQSDSEESKQSESQ